MPPSRRAGDRLHADAVPFPFGHVIARDRARRDRLPRSRAPASAGGTAPGSLRRRLVGAAFEPGEQVEIGRRQARPEHLRSRRRPCRRAPPTAVLASRAETPMRSPPVTSFSSAQRPVSSSASSQRASCAGKLRLAERGQGLDDAPTSVGAASGFVLRASGRPDQRDGLGEVADIVVGQPEQHRDPCVRRSGRGSCRAWRAGSDSAPVSAASAQPRSGSGVPRK